MKKTKNGNGRHKRLEIRNKKVRDKFKRMMNKKSPDGVQIYNTDHIIKTLSNEFYLSEMTIEKIVFSKD